MSTNNRREYPDWHRMVPERFREEVYKGNDNWVYYYNVNWELYLFYGMILHNKDYLIEGVMPNWFSTYIQDKKILPFDNKGEDVTLVFEKEKWVKNILIFHINDSVTENGMVYNIESIIVPSPEFLMGKPAPGRGACPQTTWEPYAVKYMKNLRDGTEWNPGGHY